MRIRSRVGAALAASCAVLAGLGAAPAAAGVSCNLAGTTLTITLSANADFASIHRSGNDIVVNTGSVACNVTPTVTNTDLIVVNDTSGQNTILQISSAGGPFEPGATDEAGLSDEVEIQANMGSGGDLLALSGSNGGNFWRLGKTAPGDGVNLNAGRETSGVVPGRDFDLEYFGVDGHLLLNGGVSDDAVIASGGPEFTGPLTNPISYAEELSSSRNDTIVGTDGDDIFEPGTGNDDVNGGGGADRYIEFAPGSESDDDVDLGAGVDRYEYPDTFDSPLRVDLRLTGRQDTGVLGNDALSGIEDVFGGPGDDVLIGSDGSNLLGGADGDDLLIGLGGALDLLDGANGTDTLSYAIAPSGGSQGVTVDLEAAGPQDTGGAGADVVSGFENVTGSPFTDTLFGSVLPNRFEIRDGTGDAVICRGSTDTVVADVDGVDAIAGDCETREFDFRPDTQITSGPPSVSGNATPTFTFVSDKAGSTFECSLDGAEFSACSSPHTLAPVPAGAHVFAARARDMLGALDLSPSAAAFSVDTSSPLGPGSPAPSFGARTLVTVALAATRIPATGPLPVRITNANDFDVVGRLSGEATARVSLSARRRVSLRSRGFSVRADSRKIVRLSLPRALRRLLRRKRRLSLRLTATVADPAGNRRTVRRTVTPKLKR